MIESIAFQTRARTIDHLGREQIADCPTAVSELWKNAYDAYARNVALNIYDGTPAIATIVDDGHGMNRTEFIDRWLVVGTESKADQKETPIEDRDGLPLRIKQGQKGIGRLSSANLGSLLLVVSKRRYDPFVAALVDWRLFENPYLFLLDIEIPVVEFEEKHQILELLPELFKRLRSNLTGSGEPSKYERDQRIQTAWEMFSFLEDAQGKYESTFSQIEGTINKTIFEEKHFADWPLWQKKKDKGTILVISNIQFDLESQLPRNDKVADSAISQARELLFQTLSDFSDPFLDDEERKAGYGSIDFSTHITAWEGGLQRKLVDDNHPMDYQVLLDLEHVVDGEVDEYGVFRGRIKAFGIWQEGQIVIPPAIDIPTRKDSRVGPFRLRIGTFEQKPEYSSHSAEQFQMLEAQAKMYSGFLLYRNGLKVMPYGREGSDYFRIEKRRSMHLGREFWSIRRLFGRVAIRKEQNPNLRDKAGREGFIDNKAAKSFRHLVENILRKTAREYFGSNADLRRKVIPDKETQYRKQKAEEARNKQRAQNRKQFRINLERNTLVIQNLATQIEELAEKVRTADLQREDVVISLRATLQEAKQNYQEVSLGEIPRNVGTLEDRYLNYRKDSRKAKELLESVSNSLDTALEKIRPRSPRDIAYSELSANAAFLHRRLRNWAQEAKKLFESELERITQIQSERNKLYHAKMLPLIDEVEHERVSLRQALEELEKERNQQDFGNAEIFEPYISALNSLKESIDLAGLARFSQDQAEELREEVDRLHRLAQLGITVEIIGHEIEGLEQTISAGLKTFPESVRQSNNYIIVRDSHEALVERLRFLSPLKLSGPKTRINLTGKLIFDYVQKFS